MPIDYKRYPPNWKKEIRPAILARANNRCEWPGCPFHNGQMVYVGKHEKTGKNDWFETRDLAVAAVGEFLVLPHKTKVVLTIAHLDHDETNHDVKMDRLMAMCQLHHLRYDAKEKYRRVMSKPDSLTPLTPNK
jgi:hypothetical protein